MGLGRPGHAAPLGEPARSVDVGRRSRPERRRDHRDAAGGAPGHRARGGSGARLRHGRAVTAVIAAVLAAAAVWYVLAPLWRGAASDRSAPAERARLEEERETALRVL